MHGVSINPRCVAVLGTGSAGLRHLAALKRIGGERPIAIPAHPGRRCEAEKLGYDTAGSLDEAIERWGIDRCIVATETGRHFQDGQDALARGIHLLVEKPLCSDVAQAHQLWLQSQATRRALYVGCVLRGAQSLNRLRGQMGGLGRIHAIRIECQSYLPSWRPNRPYRESYSARSDDGGVLRDLIHEIDYAGWLFGWPDKVRALVQNRGRLGIESEESADLEWETAEGAVLSMRLDYLTKPARRRVVIFGEYGTGEWDGIRHAVRWSLDGRPVEETIAAQTLDDLFETQARAFLQADPASERFPVSGLDGIRALAVCEAARRASDGLAVEKVVYP